jgi:hypothetical protein
MEHVFSPRLLWMESETVEQVVEAEVFLAENSASSARPSQNHFDVR